MKDIGYSGQYLDDKEFRLKFRTGGDILNAANDAVAGEILLQTGVSPSVYIATQTSTINSNSIFKIADLTEKVGEAPPPSNYEIIIGPTISSGTVSSNVSSATEGETVTLTITPDSGYDLSSITADNGVTLSGSGNTRTFTMPAATVTIEASFATTSTTPAEYQAIEAAYNDLTKPKILELEAVEYDDVFGPQDGLRFVILDKRSIPADAILGIQIGSDGTYSGGGDLAPPGTSQNPVYEYIKEGSIYTGIVPRNAISSDTSMEDVRCFFSENNSILGDFSDVAKVDADTQGEIYKYFYTDYTLSDGTIIPAADKFKIISTSSKTSAILNTFVFERSLTFQNPFGQNKGSTGLPLYIGPQHVYDNGSDADVTGVNSQSWLEPVSFDSVNQIATYKLKGVEYQSSSPNYLPFAYGGLSETFTINFSDLVFSANPSIPSVGFDLEEIVS